MHTLEYPHSIGLKAVSVIDTIHNLLLLIDAIPIDAIIPLYGKLSMVLRRPRHPMGLRSHKRCIIAHDQICESN